MKRLRHPTLAVLVAACVLFLGGVLSAQAVGHTVHHAHHNAQMHSSALCAWMCAAGQVVQASDAGLNAPSLLRIETDAWTPSSTDFLTAKSPRSRAPPSLTQLP